MTGNHLFATPEDVCDRSGALTTIHRMSVAQTTDESPSYTVRDEESAPLQNSNSSSLNDDRLLQKARLAKNGEKFTALWEGHTHGYESHSKADMALCCLLAFWTGNGASRMDRIFRRSGLMRPKWDEVHYADGATYGERTVERACERVSEQYSKSSED